MKEKNLVSLFFLIKIRSTSASSLSTVVLQLDDSGIDSTRAVNVEGISRKSQTDADEEATKERKVLITCEYD